MFLNKTKLIFGVLILIVVGELIYGGFTLWKVRNTPRPPVSNAVSPVSGGKIVLFTQTTNYHKGEIIPVSIRISTGGHSTDGTDLVLHFDPKVLTASTSSFIQGSIYQDYPLISIDPQAGLVRISGISSASSTGFSGVGVFGELRFTAIGTGQTAVTVDFHPNLTTDSNMVEAKTSKDIIESVTNLNLKIQ